MRKLVCFSVCACACVRACVRVCFGRPDTKRHFQNVAEFMRIEVKSRTIITTELSGVN